MGKYTLNKRKIPIMPDILGIYSIEITFTETEIMDGIQDIGFTNTVVSYKAIDAWREFYFNFFKILEVNQGY